MLPDEIKPAMEGVIPSVIVTSSAEGIPNATFISQIFYIDADHVALTHQFFNKTVRNIRENPYLTAMCTAPKTLQTFYLELQFDHSETDGPLFDMMDMRLEAIASMTGMSGIFKLQAADVYRVLSVRKANIRVNP